MIEKLIADAALVSVAGLLVIKTINVQNELKSLKIYMVKVCEKLGIDCILKDV